MTSSLDATLQRTEQCSKVIPLLQSLANKLNSNEEFNPQQGFEVLLSVVAMPTQGSGHGKKHNPGRRCLEQSLKRKHSVITIKNQDQLCCAREEEGQKFQEAIGSEYQESKAFENDTERE